MADQGHVMLERRPPIQDKLDWMRWPALRVYSVRITSPLLLADDFRRVYDSQLTTPRRPPFSTAHGAAPFSTAGSGTPSQGDQ